MRQTKLAAARAGGRAARRRGAAAAVRAAAVRAAPSRGMTHVAAPRRSPPPLPLKCNNSRRAWSHLPLAAPRASPRRPR
jgi:hypothetical protein